MTLRSRFFAATYDRSMARVDKAGLSAHREAVLAEASGRVLEVGAGTVLGTESGPDQMPPPDVN